MQHKSTPRITTLSSTQFVRFKTALVGGQGGSRIVLNLVARVYLLSTCVGKDFTLLSRTFEYSFSPFFDLLLRLSYFRLHKIGRLWLPLYKKASDQEMLLAFRHLLI